MSDEVIVQNCSPTLAGLKTGNLFSAEFQSKQELLNDIRILNKRLSPKGLRIIPMRYMEKRALLYLYRPSHLKEDLSSEEAYNILMNMGYNCASPEECIAKLIKKLKSAAEFPHEIGLFLGYPPEDVRGFIENNAANYKLIGTWKVYGDEKKAAETFNKFQKCTNVYCRQWKNGRSIEQLSVAV